MVQLQAIHTPIYVILRHIAYLYLLKLQDWTSLFWLDADIVRTVGKYVLKYIVKTPQQVDCTTYMNIHIMVMI